MIADLRGRTVLVVGLSPPLATAFHAAFVGHGATCLQAAAVDFEEALERVRAEKVQLDGLICGAATSTTPVAGLDEYRVEALTRAIRDGVWPPFAWLQQARAILGRTPRYIIALSSMAPNRFAPGADFSAAGEAVLETLCRYANERLSGDDSRMNILRYRLAPARDPGADAHRFATTDEVARAAVGMCSGLLDSMRGEVLTVDRGAGFSDNVFRLLKTSRS
jgi:NAD(P)-dependent dehydrogenase (short-subunit alcohol dehydrogenase family)